MKKIVAFSIFFLVLSCQKEDLKLVNPNSPGIASLDNEAGLKAFALGLNEKAYGWILDGWLLIALGYHSAMGDEIFIPWGNFYYRWAQQYSKIKLPNNQEYLNVSDPGISQQSKLQSFNTRSQSSGTFMWEWYGAYFTIAQANKLIETLNDTSNPIEFTGDAQTKVKTLMAWALWWKGYMYSRVGSMYLAGLIVDQLGSTNADYQDRKLIIDEATRNFDEAILLLNELEENADYREIMTAIIPDFNDNQNIVSPSMWVRMINTYKARNILVNKKVVEMTSSDWDIIQGLAINGLKPTDNIFTLGMTANGINDLAQNLHPHINCNDASTWWLASERLIQEYGPGDARLARNFHRIADPYVNTRNRGWIFGTRYGFINIEDGGSFATAQGEGQWPISPTYEENQLMLAEAKIRTGDTDGGLAFVDEVRAFQKAGIPTVTGSGLTQAHGIEELRRERRVSLALRGLAFYDARRLGITSPANLGGGRSQAMIVVPANVYDPEGDGIPEAYPCSLDYDYMDYWDVPANELDFNIPLAGSPKVKN